MTHAYRYSLVSLMALGVALPAMAQEQTAPAANQAAPAPRERETIIVTANKREENVQDIAVAITALSAESKQEFGVISVTDLTNVTPGLSYTPGNERVTLRGIGRLSNSFGADPGVANYNDGIYTAFAVNAGKDPLLIDRVEVLRGPQGTLYGRNAIGGAINTISKRPTDDFKADALFGAGNYGAKKIGVGLSGPITDWLRYRVAGLKENRDGIDFNYGTGETEGWEINDEYLELQLEGDIGDRFTWWMKTTDTDYEKAGPPGGRTAGFGTAPFLTNVSNAVQFSSGGITPNGAFGFGNNPSIISVTQGGNRRDNPYATSGEHAYNTNVASIAQLDGYDDFTLEAIYEAGPFDIKYVGGYAYYAYRLETDGDGTPITSVTYNAVSSVAPVAACAGTAAALGYPLAGNPLPAVAQGCITGTRTRTLRPSNTNSYEESRAFFSNEINLISTTDGPLQWIAGAYQYQENSKQPGQVQYLRDEPLADFYIDSVLGRVANPDREVQRFSNTSLFNAYGVFGQADYTFNDQWKVAAGLRWSKDVKDSAEEAFLACYIICGVDYLNYTRIAYTQATTPGPTITYDNEGVARRRLKGSWEAITGTASVEYRPTLDALMFAKYSRGYKSGGFNNLGFNPNPYTNAEFVDAIEGGWKQDWRAANLTTNAALFFYNYTDFQAPLTVIQGEQGTTGSTTSTAFVNVPKAETYGFELESNWSPIEPLNIGFTYAYLHAEVKESGRYVDASRNPRCVGATPGTQVTCSATANVFVDPLRTRLVEGNTLPQSPEHKVSLTGSYRFDMEDGSYFLPTVSYSWRDSFYDTFFNNELEEAPAYDNLDTRLNWYSSDGMFQVTAWVRNVLDEDQATSFSANNFRVQDSGRYQTQNFSLPRTYGIDLLFHY